MIQRVLGLAGLAIVGIGVSVLAVSHISAVAFAGAESDWATSYYDRLQCVGDLILADIPEEGVIYIDTLDGELGLEWTQRLTEITFPERQLTNVPDEADFTVTLLEGAAFGRCDDVDVRIESQ